MKRKGKLDYEDRMIIQACLINGNNLTKIARRLNVSKSTISRELQRNIRIVSGNGPCKSVNKLPVCNTCSKKGYCSRMKRYYDYKFAQELSDKRKVDSRSQPKLDSNLIRLIDPIVQEGVNLGQSLHHIYISDSQIQKICCERTVRRLVYRGNLSTKSHELRHYVRYKREYKKTKQELCLRDIRVLINRTFKDFTAVKSANKRLNIVQYDSIIGKRDDQNSILTINFPKYNFQFGLLIKKGSAISVNWQIEHMLDKLSKEKIEEIFPLNLCDNGTEFTSFFSIESFARKKQALIRTFYTSPYKSTDKAECERNHELVRYILPKGKSLNNITQNTLNDVFSNINSYVRKSKGNQTPYDLVKKEFGKDFLDVIGIRRIPNKKVRLTQII